jgi:hypothetical protein
MAFLARDEVERALRRAQIDRPPWQPLDLTFEAIRLSGPQSVPRQAATSPQSHTNSRTDLLVTDGITVARVADAALFAPEPIVSERGIAAYEAALRVRHELDSGSRYQPEDGAAITASRDGGEAAVRGEGGLRQ